MLLLPTLILDTLLSHEGWQDSSVKTTAQQVWETALGQLQLQVSRPSYETWLRDTVGLSIDQDFMTVGVPTPFAAEWLERRMYLLLQRTVGEVTRTTVHLQFQVVSPHRSNGTNGNGFSPEVSHSQPTLEESNRSDVSVSPHANNGNTPGINKRYSFGTFVVGKSNQLAHAAATAVAERPGEAYNPLFTYGGVGLGKTHLMHAIARDAAQRHFSYLYVTAEQFTNDFIRAIRGRSNEQFNAKYRSVDILLIDDIQFFNGKEQTLEAFFHTYNDLHNSGRQVVITCDCGPKALLQLDDRLRSRFEGGLIAEIQAPDLETRLAILSAKASSLGIPVGNEVFEFIANRVVNNIRELEGTLNRLAAWAHFKNVPISLELASVALPDLSLNRTPSMPSPAEVIQKAAEHFGVSLADVTGHSRDRQSTLARQVAMTLLATDSHLATKDVAALFGHRSSSVITKACTKVSSLQKSNASFQQELSSLRNAISKQE